MNLEEAQAWLRGERSTWNNHAGRNQRSSDDLVNCAKEDAARTEQAYWISKASKEGLCGE